MNSYDQMTHEQQITKPASVHFMKSWENYATLFDADLTIKLERLEFFYETCGKKRSCSIQCYAMQCNAMQYNTIQYNTIQYNKNKS